MPAPRKRYVIFVNVTKFCNMYCERCYLSPESRDRKTVLDAETFLKFTSYFNGSDVTFVWQGGEVSSVGEDVFTKLYGIAQANKEQQRHAIVSNLYNLPAWLISFLSEHKECSIETSFALGSKASRCGSESMYLERFRKNLKQLVALGIDCPVNVELNRETIAAGPGALVEYIISTGAKTWDIDISIEIAAQLKSRDFPVFESMVSYAEISNFLKELYFKYWSVLEENRIKLNPISAILNNSESLAFATPDTVDSFFTINPDGNVTSLPVFSDISSSFFGNVIDSSVEAIVRSPLRMKHIKYAKERTRTCLVSCEFYNSCKGGTAYFELLDSSGECVGFKGLRKSLTDVSN